MTSDAGVIVILLLIPGPYLLGDPVLTLLCALMSAGLGFWCGRHRGR